MLFFKFNILYLRRALAPVATIFFYTVFTLGPVHATEKSILAFGDSLTAGFGLNVSDSFPSRLQIALRAAGHRVRVINGGVSGDTTAGGLARIDWLMEDPPDLVIVELGGNDALRGLPPVGTQRNLNDIIKRSKEKGAKVILTGILAPPNMGKAYTTAFNPIFRKLARSHNVPLYPFFLEGVIQEPALMLPDGIHPNAKGVAVIVEQILPVVLQTLGEKQK
ncbi:MAG: arylesterase [Rhodospirillaceae bacterium]|nr:arylesterase [Rhodospirillaceae bacterium]